MKLSISIAHFLFGIRRFQNRNIKNIAKKIRNKKILELGSGKKINGKYTYSVKRFFDNSNEFIMSDINPKFGHKTIDITKLDVKHKFDVILCLNVLEHVFDFRKAIDNLYNALKPEGIALIVVPAYYPLHDEPRDYWRFTEHALKKLFSKFSINIKICGLRKYPIGYFLVAKKKQN